MQMQDAVLLRAGRSAAIFLTRSQSRPTGLFVALFFAAIFFTFTPSLHAQFNASLRGTVTDPSGAVIPGATVTIVDKATNYTQKTTTNGAGIYTFNALPPAPYQVTAAKPGFKAKVLAHVEIIPEQANELNIQLVIGAATQTVTVSAVTHALPSTPTLSTTITSAQIQHMPSLNRDVFQLAQLTPGTLDIAGQGSGGGGYDQPGNAGPGAASGSSSGIFQTENVPQLQSMGGRSDANGVSVDGISTESAVWGGASVITPSEDSVQSVHVVSNDYNAENGRFSGANIEVITKSGTNTFHGSAFFRAARPGLNAYQRWNGTGSNHAPSCPTGTPVTQTCLAASRGVNRYDADFNNYGGSLGGPIWKNRIFAFFNVETSPLQSNTTSQGWYETPQFDSLTGIAPIATKYLTFAGEGVAPGSTIVPQTCSSIGLTEGVNCNTESGGLNVGSPMTTGVGNQDLTWRSTGTPGVGGGLGTTPDIAYYDTVDPTTKSQTQYNGRLDADVTQKDRLTFTIYWEPVNTTDYNGPDRAANLWHQDEVNDAFTLIWNHTFSPTLLNQARANASGYRWNELSSNPQEPFGLPEDNIGDIGTMPAFQYFGAPGPSVLNQWTYGYNDVLTKVLRRQNIKAGGSLTRLYYLNDNIAAAMPSFYFNNLWDFANDAPYQETGTFNPATGVPLANRQDDRENIWGFFVQDDYKMRPNLTLTAGLRWSYFAPYYSKEGNLSVLELGSGANALTGMHMRVGGNLATSAKNDWGPQIGFAWQPSNEQGKLVFRGGFGINYNQNEIAILANGFGNPPTLVNAKYTCPYPYTRNPSCAGNGILYETSSSPTSIFGYAPNPAAITSFSSANLPLTGLTGVTGLPAHTKNITNYHYSLETDLQLPFSTVFTLSYQGDEMRHLLIQNNQLAIAAQSGLAMNSVVNSIDWYENSANGNYNALLTTLTHNFSHHFQAEAQYTWSKTMDELSSPYEEDPYPYDTHAAYGRADYNVTDATKLFGMWQPDLFPGHRWAQKIVGGWTLTGIWNLDTGFPWNPVYSVVSGDLYCTSCGYGTLRPAGIVQGFGKNTSNKVFQGLEPGSYKINSNYGGNGTAFFTPPAYIPAPAFPATAPGPAPGIQRNSLNGPGYNDFDATLAKAFGLPNNRILGDNANLNFRVDTYNLFNKTNINTGCMDTTLGSVNPNGTVASVNSDFGIACGALGGRTVQLQTRFSF